MVHIGEDVNSSSQELDLTLEEAPGSLDVASLLGVEPPSDEGPWNQERQREGVRGRLSQHLLWLLTGLVASGILLLALARYTQVPAAELRSFFEVVFIPVVTLVSAATGFYFGTSSNVDRRERGG